MSEPSDKTSAVFPEAAPPALPSHTVTLLLSYLSPLESPLPPHLLSEPLRQRHHFLGLGGTFESAEDVAAYISWPSSVTHENITSHIVKLLSDLPPPDTFDPLVAYPTKYSCDGETVYAHSHVSQKSSSRAVDNDLRLVFRWEAGEGQGFVRGHDGHTTNADGWKFHDAKPMPFPQGVYDTPQDAINTVRPTGGVTSIINAESRGASAPKLDRGLDDALQSDDDDDYWNSYGQSSSNDEHESQGFARASGSRNDPNSEDAYWARYASVHGMGSFLNNIPSLSFALPGTADSTRPSPPVSRRKLHDPSQPLPAPSNDGYSTGKASHDTEKYDAYDLDMDRVNRMRYLLDLQGTFSPDVMSPEALANRLYALSPRASFSSSSLLGEALPNAPTEPDSNEFESSVSSHSDGRVFSPEEAHACQESVTPATKTIPSSDNVVSNTDPGLREAIKGLFHLWAHSRNSRTSESEPDKEEFLRIVHDSI